VSVTAAPPAGTFHASARPPCASAIARAGASPRPAPDDRLSNRLNGWNAAASAASLNPGPPSWTMIDTAPAASGRVDGHASPGRTVADGVVQQVVDRLTYARRIELHDLVAGPHNQLHFTIACHPGEGLRALADQRRQGGRRALDRHPSLHRPCDHEQPG